MSLLHYWDTQRSVKRRRTSEKDTDLESTASEKRPASPSPSSGVVDTPTPVPVAEEPGTDIPSSQTELETSLPAIQTDEDAIKAYEASKAEQDADAGAEPGLHVRLRDGVWQRGKSSIYVDAFNLALDTVLDEESHLFNEAEMEVFKQWKELSYESQYLYVLTTPVTFDFLAVHYGVDLSLKICTAFPSQNLCVASYQSIGLLFRHLGLVCGSYGSPARSRLTQERGPRYGRPRLRSEFSVRRRDG